MGAYKNAHTTLAGVEKKMSFFLVLLPLQFPNLNNFPTFFIRINIFKNSRF